MATQTQVPFPSQRRQIDKIGPFLPTAVAVERLLIGAGFQVEHDVVGGNSRLKAFDDSCISAGVLWLEDGSLTAEEAKALTRLLDRAISKTTRVPA